ncbi:hypothetical protein FQN60_013075 [Etheostoma spectabile]|uniref:Uncharacterized protein n=1 Tax=Etheostoma spectabile TaxID=54343 RepID=A0A5J5DA35_9PERO|nr:hypothetical protein FQN60_013075 [Etheostoma spectabile]
MVQSSCLQEQANGSPLTNVSINHGLLWSGLGDNFSPATTQCNNQVCKTSHWRIFTEDKIKAFNMTPISMGKDVIKAAPAQQTSCRSKSPHPPYRRLAEELQRQQIRRSSSSCKDENRSRRHVTYVFGTLTNCCLGSESPTPGSGFSPECQCQRGESSRRKHDENNSEMNQLSIRPKHCAAVVQLPTVLFRDGSWGTRHTGGLPPTRYTLLSLAASDSACVDSPGILSAYSGKKLLPYGELKHSCIFHDSSTTLLPCPAASFTSPRTLLRLSALTRDTCSWTTARRNSNNHNHNLYNYSLILTVYGCYGLKNYHVKENGWPTVEHPSISTLTACPTGPAASREPARSQTRTHRASQSTLQRCFQQGGHPRESGRRVHSWQTETLVTVCVTAGRHDPVVSLYELSRASRTFMICCLMTLVASPALGIKYLKGGKAEEREVK